MIIKIFFLLFCSNSNFSFYFFFFNNNKMPWLQICTTRRCSSSKYSIIVSNGQILVGRTDGRRPGPDGKGPRRPDGQNKQGLALSHFPHCTTAGWLCVLRQLATKSKPNEVDFAWFCDGFGSLSERETLRTHAVVTRTAGLRATGKTFAAWGPNAQRFRSEMVPIAPPS